MFCSTHVLFKRKLQSTTAERCSAGAQGGQPSGSMQSTAFPERHQRPAAPACCNLLWAADILQPTLVTRTHAFVPQQASSTSSIGA